ncbi:MAG: hypothetical protein CM1200mP28_06380 [Deltaproteobacteria bacterium]|nr:MAG: hypothetical protein CM1200mP28_06380 [Deltaproteobacteria bacterium]
MSECDRNSIEEDGIRLPLLVQPVEDSKFRLVDGFKRLSWLKLVQGKSVEEYQQEQLSCLIIPAFVSLRDVAKIRLETLSADQTSFSGIHLCRVLNLLSKAGFSKNEIAFQVFPSLGLVSSVWLAGQLLDLQKKLVTYELHAESLLPESMMSMGYEDLLPLLKFSNSDFPSVVRLAEKMEVKGKKWCNLLQVLDEVARLQQTTADEILQYPEIQKILEDSNLQGPVRYRLLKQQLDALRYPELSKMRKRFDQTCKSLKLPERLTLESDQYFENDELALKIKFRSVDELREHLMNLSDTVNSENLINAWNDLFAILREE